MNIYVRANRVCARIYIYIYRCCDDLFVYFSHTHTRTKEMRTCIAHTHAGTCTCEGVLNVFYLTHFRKWGQMYEFCGEGFLGRVEKLSASSRIWQCMQNYISKFSLAWGHYNEALVYVKLITLCSCLSIELLNILMFLLSWWAVVPLMESHWNSSSFQTSTGTRIFVLSLKMPEGPITEDAGRMVISLYRLGKWLTPITILCLYESQIRPTTEYFSYSCPVLTVLLSSKAIKRLCE